MGRNSSFNSAEVNKLLEVITKYKSILECKKTDVRTAKAKEDAWEKVANDFNATNAVYRDVKELRTKYKNIRYANKIKLFAERKTVLTETKTKWIEEKLRTDVENEKKLSAQSDERHKIEMQILDVRLEREQLLLEREKMELMKLKLSLK